jgi:hypothetical protein
VSTFFLLLPEDRFEAEIVDGEIVRCRSKTWYRSAKRMEARQQDGGLLRFVRRRQLRGVSSGRARNVLARMAGLERCRAASVRILQWVDVTR